MTSSGAVSNFPFRNSIPPGSVNFKRFAEAPAWHGYPSSFRSDMGDGPHSVIRTVSCLSEVAYVSTISCVRGYNGKSNAWKTHVTPVHIPDFYYRLFLVLFERMGNFTRQTCSLPRRNLGFRHDFGRSAADDQLLQGDRPATKRMLLRPCRAATASYLIIQQHWNILFQV